MFHFVVSFLIFHILITRNVAQLYDTLTDELRTYLVDLQNQQLQPDAMIDHLKKLKESGFEPKVIYDIGACVLHWTKIAKKFWPDATYILFEASDKPEFLYQESGHPYHMGVLSDVDDKELRFYQNDKFPGGNSYFREIRSVGFFSEHSYRTLRSRSLESVVKERGFPLPDLVKIDVQGAEVDVLKGGWSVVNHASYMIVEMQHTNYNDGAPKVDTTLPWIESNGWKCTAPSFHASPVDADYGFVRLKKSKNN